MREWFVGCDTVEDVRNRYRELAKKYHPDVGGSNEEMKHINTAYDTACRYYTRRQNPDKTEEQWADLDKVNERIRKVILELLRLKGVEIEICGWWVWVSGDTRAVKEQLKELGLRFAPKKKMWYYAGIPSHNRKTWSMDSIRWAYGSEKVRHEEEREYAKIG